MDNLTHSLVGAVLGRMGLKRLSPRAMPALIVAANLPDIDSFIARPLGLSPLTFHRGFTHGIGGLVTMPLLAFAIIWVWEKLRPGKEGPIRGAGLLLACFLGVLSHPALDFLNTYGIRLLEPFSHRWFYGDTLFIVDPWIWIMLILGLEFSWRAERLEQNWERPAAYAFCAVLAYIGVNAAISVHAVAAGRPLISRVEQPTMIVAGEVPLEFWKRQVMWRGSTVAGTVDYDLLGDIARLEPDNAPDQSGQERSKTNGRRDEAQQEDPDEKRRGATAVVAARRAADELADPT